MPYLYTDPARETDPHALPDVEVFEDFAWNCECLCGTYDVPGDYVDTGPAVCPSCGDDGCTFKPQEIGSQWWYAYGFPGYLWESGPFGPFGTMKLTLIDARENAGIEEGA